MDFSEALKLLKQGATLRRDSWSESKHIELISDKNSDLFLPYIRITTKNKTGVYTATNFDILANDWVLLEQNKIVKRLIINENENISTDY